MTRPYTKKYTKKADVLTTQITVRNPYNNRKCEVKALWDTGAVHSCIMEHVKEQLNMKAVGLCDIASSTGTAQVERCMAIFGLPNDNNFRVQVNVLKSSIKTYGAIIGMDIISQVDFAITNFKGKTVYSFRNPSEETIDFEKKNQQQG